VKPATIVPIALGCCSDEPRCLLCPPAPPRPDRDLVQALIVHYDDGEEPLRVGFFGGAPPDDELLDAIDGLPFVARVRPDLLSRADAVRLARRGAIGIELDALTFVDAALKGVGRRYRAARVEEQLEGIASLGIEPGIVLAPGLPGTTHADAVADARKAAPMVRFARIHPVLVLDRCGLREAHQGGTYVPLELGEAVTTCRAMLEVFRDAGVDVVRVGQNPGPDGLGRALAGPRHPALRQLVEGRMVLEVLRSRLIQARRGSRVVVRCHPADETQTRGPLNQQVRTLRAAFRLAALEIRPDPAVARGEYEIQWSAEDDEVLS
jgi:hypothetical protein